MYDFDFWFQYYEGTIDKYVLPASAQFSTSCKYSTIGPNQRVPMRCVVGINRCVVGINRLCSATLDDVMF